MFRKRNDVSVFSFRRALESPLLPLDIRRFGMDNPRLTPPPIEPPVHVNNPQPAALAFESTAKRAPWRRVLTPNARVTEVPLAPVAHQPTSASPSPAVLGENPPAASPSFAVGGEKAKLIFKRAPSVAESGSSPAPVVELSTSELLKEYDRRKLQVKPTAPATPLPPGMRRDVMFDADYIPPPPGSPDDDDAAYEPQAQPKHTDGKPVSPIVPWSVLESQRATVSFHSKEKDAFMAPESSAPSAAPRPELQLAVKRQQEARLLPHPDRQRFYSKSEWEFIDDWVTLSPYTCASVLEGETTSFRKRRSEIYFAVGHLDGSVEVMDCSLLAKGKRLGVVKCFEHLHAGPIRLLQSIEGEGGTVLVSGGDDGVLRKTDIASGRILASFYVDGSVTAFHSHLNLVAVGSSTGTVCVFVRSQPQKPYAEIYHLSSEVTALSINAENGELILCDRKKIAVCHIQQSQVCQVLTLFSNPVLKTVIVARERCVIVALTIDGWMFRLARGSPNDGFVSHHQLVLQENSSNTNLRLPGDDVTGPRDAFFLPGTNDDEEGDRFVTVQDDALIRVWQYPPRPYSEHQLEGNEGLRRENETSRPTVASNFHHVRDLQPVRAKQLLSPDSLEQVLIIHDRFALFRAGVQLLLMNCSTSIYESRELYTQEMIKRYIGSPVPGPSPAATTPGSDRRASLQRSGPGRGKDSSVPTLTSAYSDRRSHSRDQRPESPFRHHPAVVGPGYKDKSTLQWEASLR
jgi:hypothetical protein